MGGFPAGLVYVDQVEAGVGPPPASDGGARWTALRARPRTSQSVDSTRVRFMRLGYHAVAKQGLLSVG